VEGDNADAGVKHDHRGGGPGDLQTLAESAFSPVLVVRISNMKNPGRCFRIDATGVPNDYSKGMGAEFQENPYAAAVESALEEISSDL
jgi:hypothetical protein